MTPEIIGAIHQDAGDPTLWWYWKNGSPLPRTYRRVEDVPELAQVNGFVPNATTLDTYILVAKDGDVLGGVTQASRAGCLVRVAGVITPCPDTQVFVQADIPGSVLLDPTAKLKKVGGGYPSPAVRLETVPTSMVGSRGGHTATLREGAAGALKDLLSLVHVQGETLCVSASSWSSIYLTADDALTYLQGRMYGALKRTVRLHPKMGLTPKGPYLVTASEEGVAIWCRTENPEVPEVELVPQYLKGGACKPGASTVVRAFNVTSLAASVGYASYCNLPGPLQDQRLQEAWNVLVWTGGLVEGTTTLLDDALLSEGEGIRLQFQGGYSYLGSRVFGVTW